MFCPSKSKVLPYGIFGNLYTCLYTLYLLVFQSSGHLLERPEYQQWSAWSCLNQI